MYWQLTQMLRQEPEPSAMDAPCFVLHKHDDASGPHHDLRLEEGNCLLGFRIAGDTVEPGCWATEKIPYSKRICFFNHHIAYIFYLLSEDR